MGKTLLTLATLLFLVSFETSAQYNKQLDTAISFTSVKIGFGFQWPYADLKDRFGSNTNLEAAFSYKHKSNFFISVQGNFLFGTDVKEDGILDQIKTDKGYVINNGGELTNVLLLERGFAIFGSIGKMIPVLSPNANSGFIVSGGVGFLQHKIKIDYRDGKIFNLDEDYREGYDRLSNGLALIGFFGYEYHSNWRLINFYLGFDYMYGFTQNRRGFNFDTGEIDNNKRKDALTGIKLGWSLPLYKSKPADFYYY